MKKIIASIITLGGAMCMCGMEEPPLRPTQSVEGHVKNLKVALVSIFTPEQNMKRDREKSQARQQRKLQGEYVLQELPENFDQAVIKKTKFSFSTILKSTTQITLALWSIVHTVASFPARAICGKQPVLGEYPYLYERSLNDLEQGPNIDAAQQLFTEQAKEAAAVRNFQMKYTVAWSALLAAVSAGVASYKCGCNSTAAQIGSCIGLTAAVLSWLASGSSACIRDVKKRQKARILGLSGVPLSPQEANVAYTRTVGGGFFSGLHLYGPFGLLAARTMRNVVRSNFDLTTRLIDSPVA